MAQLVPSHLGRQEAADDVVSRFVLALLDQIGEVAVDDPGALVVHGTTSVRVDVGGRVELGGMQDVVPHVEEHAHLILGKTEETEEDGGWEQFGDLLGEIALTAVYERVR